MKKLLLAFLLTLGVISLAACGGDDPVDPDPGTEDPGTEEPTPEPSQGVTDDTVTVGNTVATSGNLAFVGVPFRTAMEAYFDMVNDAGGVNGRTIEYIQYDDEFNAANGLSLTQQLVEDDEVFALVGHFGTPTVSATLDYLNGVGIPRVYYATGISALFAPNATDGELGSFPVQPIYDAEGEVMVARAVGDLGASKIGVIYSNDDAGLGLYNGIELRADALNLDVEAVQIDPSSDDLSSAAQTMLDFDPDVILVASNQVPAATAVRALNLAGSDIPVITSYVNADATWLGGVQEVIPNFDVYASAWINIFAEDGVNFSDDYTEFATVISEYDAELAANSFAFAGWIAAATFVAGLERVGDDVLTWDNYIAAMEESLVELPFGVILDYASGSRVGTQAMAFLKGEVTDGVAAFSTVDPIRTIDEILE